MIYYIIVFLLILYATFINGGVVSNSNKWVYYFVIPFFICFGYMTGSDWRVYELMYYNRLSLTDSMPEEPGYMLLVSVSKFLGLGFWEFSIIIKLIGYYVFFHYYRYFSNNSMWGIIYWFSLFALFLWLDHPARNFIAIIIFTFGLKYLLQRKICKYFFVCILASLFHASCIAMIPFYFFTQKLDSKKYKLALLLILAVYLWSSLLRDFIDTIVQVPIFLRLSSYTFDDYQGQMSIIKFIIIKGILILAVFNIDSLRKKYKYADFILVLSIIYAFLFSIANLNNILFRLQFYFAIPFVILISFLSSNAVSKRIRLSIRTFVIIFSFAYLLNLISRDYRYVPYSNYAYYMFNGLPYDYRDSYNLENSPFK